MTSPTIGFLCASLRDGSINVQLRDALMPRYRDAGAAVEIVDMGDYPLPIYHGDLDAPAEVDALIARLTALDGVVIITPEYNGGLPALLKNAIDWMSTKGKSQFEGPAYAVAACTPGPLSGVVCLRGLALMLMRLGARVCPTFLGVGMASSAFTEDGHLATDFAQDLADTQIADMMRLVAA